MKERAMKHLFPFTPFFFWAMILLLLSAAPRAEDSNARASETLKDKAQEELEAVKKDSPKIVQDARQSAKELPSQAREEFKKIGRALKKTGKELKESTGEAVQSLKELLKK
jgi:ABC-type transporter MlaC component